MSATLAKSAPLLHNGDRLNAEEFLRRYQRMPGIKAQLIEGIVYMPSPLRAEDHGDPHAALMYWLTNYWVATPGVQPSVAATTRLGEQAVPEPDASLRIVQGGQTHLEEGYIIGAPELAIEIAASSVSIDSHAKRRDYESHGVREYLLWRVEEEAIDWWVSRQGRFEPLAAEEGGIVRSEVFPGLWLDVEAFFRLEVPRVLAVLQAGLASAEHGEFVRRLQELQEGQP
jgi:Uma2 family endonuclease